MRLVEGEEALRLLPEVHDQHRRRQPGDVARFPWLWDLLVRDPKWLREFDGPTFFAVHKAEPGTCRRPWLRGATPPTARSCWR